MSFTQLAAREADINQSLLFNTEIVEEQWCHVPTPASTRNNFIQTTCSTSMVINTETNIILPGGLVYPTMITCTSPLSHHLTVSRTSGWHIAQTSTTCVPITSTLCTMLYDFTDNSYSNIITARIYTNSDSDLDKPKRGIRKLINGSIKRALKLLDNYGMENDTRIFLNGDEIEVSHPDSLFKFVIHKNKYNKVSSGITQRLYSTPFKLSLLTKSNIHIADLCVYAENTPMLDQLLMVAMYVKSGNEEDLLRAANYRSICKDQETKELLVNEYDYLKQKLLSN